MAVAGFTAELGLEMAQLLAVGAGGLTLAGGVAELPVVESERSRTRRKEGLRGGAESRRARGIAGDEGDRNRWR